MADDKKDIIVLPEGRLINHSLFTRDQYNEQAKAKYNIEMAFEPGVLNDFYNQILDAAAEKWGNGADEDEGLHIPFLVGDKLAAKREAKGKAGDAYKGMDVIRCSTAFNKHSEDGPGGAAVYLPDVSEVTAVNQHEVYQGCYGQAAVTLGTYAANDGNNGITIYLSAFQKTRDGDKLSSSTDHSKLFKPIGRSSSSEGSEGGRRRRAG